MASDFTSPPIRPPIHPLIHPLILCGGSGTRLWPASRRARPKQFLPLIDGLSTFQLTLRRLAREGLGREGSGREEHGGFGRPVVIAGADHRFLVAEQAQAVGVAVDIVLEPEGRDSGPAFAAGAAFLEAREGARTSEGARTGEGARTSEGARTGEDPATDGDDAADASPIPAPILLALAADHLVRDADGFALTCRTALPAAAAGRIVTFGIPPEGPSGDYGYVVPGDALDAGDGVRAVERFTEKPDENDARALIERGGLWNSGNFLTRTDVLLAEYAARDAALGEGTVTAAREAVERAARDLDFVRLDAGAFARTAKRSIDYAVMEHTRHAAVVPARFDWSDIGGWDAMERALPHDGAGNAVGLLGGAANAAVHGGTAPELAPGLSPADAHVGVESRRCIVSTNGPLVATVGVENLAIVVTDDAVLVMDRARGDLMRTAVAAVAERAPWLVEEHRQSFRPWGNYRSLDVGPRHQVKRIVVKPGAILSLQHHHHRSEHWVVVTGTARVTIDERVELLRENESVYIPLGAVHRMENPGKIDLEIIEVQTGSYFGEDDIVRHEDLYARG